MRERNQPKRLVVAWKKCKMCVFQKNKNCVGLVETSKKIEHFQKKMFRSDFCGRGPAWIVKINKNIKYSSRLVSFAKVGEIQDFSLSIRPLRLAFSRMFITEKNKVQSNIALTAILKFYTFVLFLGFLLHVLSQCVDSQSAGWIFKLMQNHAHHRVHLTQRPNAPQTDYFRGFWWFLQE